MKRIEAKVLVEITVVVDVQVVSNTYVREAADTKIFNALDATAGINMTGVDLVSHKPWDKEEWC